MKGHVTDKCPPEEPTGSGAAWSLNNMSHLQLSHLPRIPNFHSDTSHFSPLSRVFQAVAPTQGCCMIFLYQLDLPSVFTTLFAAFNPPFKDPASLIVWVGTPRQASPDPVRALNVGRHGANPSSGLDAAPLRRGDPSWADAGGQVLAERAFRRGDLTLVRWDVSYMRDFRNGVRCGAGYTGGWYRQPPPAGAGYVWWTLAEVPEGVVVSGLGVALRCAS